MCVVFFFFFFFSAAEQLWSLCMAFLGCGGLSSPRHWPARLLPALSHPRQPAEGRSLPLFQYWAFPGVWGNRVTPKRCWWPDFSHGKGDFANGIQIIHYWPDILMCLFSPERYWLETYQYIFREWYHYYQASQVVKNPPANAGDMDLIPRSGRSPGEQNGKPLQCSCPRISWTEEPGGLQSLGL